MKKTIFYTNFHLLVVLALILMAAPLAWSEPPWRGTVSGRYLAIIAFVLLLFTHSQFPFKFLQQRRLWGLISAAVLIQSVVGLLEYLNILSLVTGNSSPTGVFKQRNVYGSFLATGLAVSVYEVLRGRLPRALVTLHYSVIVLVCLMQSLVLSRAGMLGAVTAVLLLCLLYRHNKRRIAKVMALVVVGIFLSVLLQYSTSSGVARSYEAISSPGYRVTLYEQSFELIKKSPLWGHGLGKFQYVFLHQQAESVHRGDDVIYNSTASIHPHNELLFWWVEGGILPVIAILLIIIVLSSAVWFKGRKTHKAIWLMMLPIVLHTQTEYPLYHSATHLFLLAILLSSIRLFNVKQLHVSVGLPFKFLAVSLSIIVSVFMVTNLHTISKVMKYVETADVGAFSEVINPVAQQRMLNAGTSIAIVRSGSSDGMPAAQKILEKESLLRPTEGISTYLYHAYRLQEMNNEMNVLLEESLYLYPESKFFRSIRMGDDK